MKNALNYYYNLYPDKIYQTKDEYYFFIYNIRYSFIKYKEDIKDIKKIYETHQNMLNQNIYIHPIILNIERNPITFINSNPYILLKTIYYGEEITLNKIVSSLYQTSEKNYVKWSQKWSVKNDYLEFQIRKLGKKYKKIRESFSYYIGLAETAIALSNLVENEEIDYYYAHKRINIKKTTLEFYNPLNIIVDVKVRDASEYFKSSFFSGKNIREKVYYYLNTQNLTIEETILFLARMLYPTYYFDLFEEIITGKMNEDKIDKIIKKEDEYEKILKDIYHICKTKTNTIQIEWLE